LTEQLKFDIINKNINGGFAMKISYNKLWKILIDKKMRKMDLQNLAGLSSASIAKLGKDEPVTMEVLIKICIALDCNIGDIVDFIKE
jgi:DNA-binding Xre family transcriptional regulator